MRIAGLWRYPVKSMQGEALAAADVDDHGLVGDRRWALLDVQSGFTLTARREPELLLATGAIEDDRPVITLPDGSTARDDGDLSDWLGRAVTLVEAGDHVRGLYETPLDAEAEDGDWIRWRGPAGSFHDSTRTQLSVLSIDTIGDWDVRRFRPNVVVDGDEDALVGTTIDLGTVTLDVMKPIDRCVVVTRAQPGLPRDLGVLRTINRERATFLGVGTLVSSPGRITVGDRVRPRQPPPGGRGSSTG
jgi:uncharacterized protein YcbX